MTGNFPRLTEILSVNFRNLTRFPSNLVVSPKSDKIVLDLSGNQINSLTYAVARYNRGDQGTRLYQNISKLWLTRNKISVFTHECLPKDLEELYLDNNHIARFQQSDINYFDSLVNRTNLRLRLGNNPYSCSCDSTPLFHFIKSRGANLEDQHTVKMKCDSQLVKSKLNQNMEILNNSEATGVVEVKPG